MAYANIGTDRGPLPVRFSGKVFEHNGVHFFAFRDQRPDYQKYVVTEWWSGSAIGYGRTAAAALDDARERINNHAYRMPTFILDTVKRSGLANL